MPLSRPLSESVVVVTGASSGIGAATAQALAERKASVVLGARRVDALREVAARCVARGAAALPVATDVTDPAAVAALAAAAEARFGRIDAWVNNAGVGLYAPLADAPVDAVRRVMEVNLFGCLHGVRAVLPRLRAAGGGVIVNVASVLSDVTVPFMGPYNISKHAVRGLSDTLRQEIADRSISVCTVLPASIDTPFYRNAANRTGRTPRPIPPVYPPELVAETIVRVLRRPRREAYAGGLGHALAIQWRLTPALVERVLAWYGRRGSFGAAAVTPTPGNLFTPGHDRADLDGGFSGRRRTALRAGIGAAGVSLGLAAIAAARAARANGSRAR
jgi:NAD(P)-dependent dehydrogenase (short-subunit alcohol dehydrogenase family)